MRGLNNISRATILAIVWLSIPGISDAAIFSDLGDDELFDRTPRVVVGRIAVADAAPGPSIDFRVEIERTVRGTASEELVLRLPGGVDNGLARVIPGLPRLRPGDRAVLFLRPEKDGRFGLSHLFLGAFAVVTGDDGTEIAVRESHGHAKRLGGGEAEAGLARDLDGFVRWLGDRGRGHRRAPDYFRSRPAADKGSGTEDAAEDTAEDVAAKWAPVESSPEAEPFGCGETGGHPVRWFDFDDGGTVGWRTHFAGQEGLADGGLNQFRAALDVWSDDPNSAIDLDFLGLTSSGHGLAGPDGLNTILFGDPGDQIPGSVADAGLLALGGPWFLCELRTYRGELFHPIIEADIITQDGLELFFAASPDPRRAAEEIFAHELGHTLGFAHTPEPEALMFATAHDDGRGAVLDVDDLAGTFDHYRGGVAPLPPAAPRDLAVTAAFPTAAQLAWTDLSLDESNFRIERRQGDGPFSTIAAVAADSQAYFDPSLAPETSYSYRIRAQNAAGASDYSDAAEVTTPEDPRPEPPSNLRAAPMSSDRVRLAWQNNSDDETSFALSLLDVNTQSFVEIPYAIPAGTTTVQLFGLLPGVEYTFRIRARNRFGTSAPSNSTAVTTFEDDSGCVAGETELCLLGGRFRVELSFVTPVPPGSFTGVQSFATAIPGTDQTGLFWFFDPGNVEMIVKMLDGTGVNGHFWVFFGGISDLEYQLAITDTVTGQTVFYDNPRGEICGGADILAFKDVPASTAAPAKHRPAPQRAIDAAALADRLTIVPETSPPVAPETDLAGMDLKTDDGCTPGGEVLCALDGRLQVEVDWRNPHDGGAEGQGQAVVLSEKSGYFWFFEPENLELVVKTLDGGGINGHLWVFYGALTDLEYWVTVTDTVHGTRRVYHNPPGELCGGADILAFPLEP